MNSGSRTPKPPSPTSVASAQTGSNQSTALYETMLNMQNQTNPYGSVDWSQSGSWSYKDPATGKTVSVPRFTAVTRLSPEQQALLGQQQQFDARYNQMALDQAAQIKKTLSTPFKYNPGVHEQWAGNLYDKLNKDRLAQGYDEFTQSMANRGLNFGTQAYDQGLKDWFSGNQNARDQFMLDSYGVGMNTALTERNQPLKEGMALMGAAQITEPTWLQGPQSGVANTDIGGIYGQNYNQQLARSQQQQQAQAGMWGALGTIGGAALGGWMSDKRMKKNIKPAGKDPDTGLAVKEWEYKDGSERYQTPVAQDVEKRFPEAVSEVNGVKVVNWRNVPGGQKFEREMETGGSPLQKLGSQPNGHLVGGREMRNPGDDPYWSVQKALPPPKYQNASTRKRGLQRLGSGRAA